MGSLERRIEALEGRLGAEDAAPSGERDDLTRKVWQLTLDAYAHIRRAPIDDEGVRYEVGRLRAQSPLSIACHIIALTNLGHEDEEEARRILTEMEAERGLEDSPLWQMIDEMVAAMEQTRGDHLAS